MTKKIQVKAPTWLNKVAKAEWKRMFELFEKEKRVIEESDLKAMEGYCISYSTWRKCEEIVDEKGLTFKTPSGYEQQRPEVSIGSKAQSEMRNWMKELTFTESARSRSNKNNNTPTKSHMTEEEKEMEGLVS